MKHPSEATLALFSGGDLARFARWWTARHVEGCERCHAHVARFEISRAEAALLDRVPDVNWTRLAAEMQANIRLGLAAGEIVRTAAPSSFRPRALVAAGCVAALLVFGVWLQRPIPRAMPAGAVVLENTSDGIALRTAGQTLTLVNGRTSSVFYSAGAQGAIRARYIDAETGQVTINNVYAQ